MEAKRWAGSIDVALLELRDVSANYGNVQALHGVSLTIDDGELVALVGANGAGKTTTLRAVSGLLRPSRGQILFQGDRIDGMPAEKIAPLGISLVPEGRGIFPGLTVYENLQIATTTWYRHGMSITAELESVYRLFPVLAERKDQLGWSLSGGEQQMLAIGRALMARPRLLLLDEPSLGLAPTLVRQVFATLKRINQARTTILLVEQNAFMALRIANRGYVIENGRIAFSDTTENLTRDERVKVAYLGG